MTSSSISSTSINQSSTSSSSPSVSPLLTRSSNVQAFSSHAPAGRGPESPLAKFLIGKYIYNSNPSYIKRSNNQNIL